MQVNIDPQKIDEILTRSIDTIYPNKKSFEEILKSGILILSKYNNNYLICSGNLIENNDIPSFIEKIEIIKKMNKNELKLFYKEQILKKLSEEYKIAKQIIFTGWAEKNIISTYFWAADLGLMPEPKNEYTDNSLHNKVLEYMAAGLPIVSYDLKEAKKSATKAALFIPFNNEREFAKAICKLMDNPEQRNTMSRVASERFKQNFRQEFSQKELINLTNYMKDQKSEFGMVITISNFFFFKRESASLADEDRVTLGGMLRFNPLYSFMILDAGLPSSSIMKASYGLDTNKISRTLISINS